MTSVPLHPALVHVPLALAFLLPVLTLGFSWALWKDRIGARTWLTIVLLQAVLLGAGLVALKTGQNEEERVETVVPEAAIQTHQAYAEQFLWITGATLAAAIAVLAVRRAAAVRALTVTTLLGTFLVAGAAVRVGHAGGRLVYVHNAAAAYGARGSANAQAQKDASASPLAESKSGDDDDR